MKTQRRRLSNKRIANAVAAATFAVTFLVLALTGFAVAKLDPGRTTGPSLLLAWAVLAGVSAAVALGAWLLTSFVLKRARPDV
jgi:protein-S-isoprenylcysteine O-methyltransferase Ste14